MFVTKNAVFDSLLHTLQLLSYLPTHFETGKSFFLPALPSHSLPILLNVAKCVRGTEDRFLLSGSCECAARAFQKLWHLKTENQKICILMKCINIDCLKSDFLNILHKHQMPRGSSLFLWAMCSLSQFKRNGQFGKLELHENNKRSEMGTPTVATVFRNFFCQNRNEGVKYREIQ